MRPATAEMDGLAIQRHACPAEGRSQNDYRGIEKAAS